MPEVTGFDVIRELRSRPETADLPIVVLTAKTLEPSEHAILQRSVHTVLAKGTWDNAQFLQVVRRAVQSTSSPKGDEPLVPTTRERNTNPHRVLVVDDDVTAGDLLQLYLEDEGFAVARAVSAKEALAQLQHVDLVTLCLSSPDSDELLARLGEVGQRGAIPVLVVSRGDPLEAAAIGAQAVLTKPVRRHELLSLAERLLHPTDTHRPRVLLVDDDPKAVRIVTSYLESEAIELRSAYGGREALRIIAAQPPDLLILDLMMPEMSGFDVLSHLRNDPSTADLPVLILSAKELSEPELRSLTADVESVFSKASTKRGELLQQVRRLLGSDSEGAAPRPTR
jgi:CheY-like chemotaxis protein